MTEEPDGEPPEAEILELNGIKVPIGPHITPTILYNLRQGTYERPEARVICERLTALDTVVELGGGIGYTSALCAQRVGPSRVHVYEPDARLERPIRELYRLNGVEADLQMCGLGPREETRELHLAADFWESSFVTRHAANATSMRVPVRAFDAEIACHDPTPNFLILDIEGAERELITGVSLAGFDKLLCEVHPHLIGRRGIWAIRWTLARRGFRRDDELSTSRVWYFERRRSIRI